MLSVDVKPIGVIRRTEEPRALLQVHAPYVEALSGLAQGDRVQVLYWMHELAHADRRSLQLHPGGDTAKPKKGVFGLRSCARPNPIGVTDVEVVEVRPAALVVSGLDAHDGSPLIDIKASWCG